MRVVLDTNVVASALLWGGTPERLIRAADDEGLELFTSEALIAELAGILGRAKFAAKLAQLNSSPAEVVARYREIADIIEAAAIEEAVLRDPRGLHQALDRHRRFQPLDLCLGNARHGIRSSAKKPVKGVSQFLGG